MRSGRTTGDEDTIQKRRQAGRSRVLPLAMIIGTALFVRPLLAAAEASPSAARLPESLPVTQAMPAATTAKGGAASLPSPVAFSNTLELGDVGLAERWLDAGLPPGFLGSRIGSGLMIGAWEGNLALMRLFLSRGADINQLNVNGESALALAAWRGQRTAVHWLLERGARLNPPPRQWSALHYAVFAGQRELVDELLAQGADLNALSTNGSTPLMMAIYEGHQDLARHLIDKGADPRPKNDWGDGALQWAMRYNQLDIARRVADAEQFTAAINQPKESWGEPVRSRRMSKALEELLSIREKLLERGLSTAALDQRIAAERVRLVREAFDTARPSPAATLEITANRQRPAEQSAQLVSGEPGRAAGYKVPPSTYSGRPRMPAKAPVRNY